MRVKLQHHRELGEFHGRQVQLLPDHTAREERDVIAWAKWFEDTPSRVVKQEQIGPYWISTVFLGIDHNFTRFMNPKSQSRPLLFETMVFADTGSPPLAPDETVSMRLADGVEMMPREEVDDMTERCSTWDEAVAQHERIADQLRRKE